MSMLMIGEEGLATSGIPDLYCLISTPGGEARAIGGPGHVFNCILMAAIGEEQRSNRGNYGGLGGGRSGGKRATCACKRGEPPSNEHESCQIAQDGAARQTLLSGQQTKGS